MPNSWLATTDSFKIGLATGLTIVQDPFNDSFLRIYALHRRTAETLLSYKAGLGAKRIGKNKSRHLLPNEADFKNLNNIEIKMKISSGKFILSETYQ